MEKKCIFRSQFAGFGALLLPEVPIQTQVAYRYKKIISLFCLPSFLFPFLFLFFSFLFFFLPFFLLFGTPSVTLVAEAPKAPRIPPCNALRESKIYKIMLRQCFMAQLYVHFHHFTGEHFMGQGLCRSHSRSIKGHLSQKSLVATRRDHQLTLTQLEVSSHRNTCTQWLPNWS